MYSVNVFIYLSFQIMFPIRGSDVQYMCSIYNDTISTRFNIMIFTFDHSKYCDKRNLIIKSLQCACIFKFKIWQLTISHAKFYQKTPHLVKYFYMQFIHNINM